MSTHLLTDDELAKVITISVRAFAKTLGFDLNGRTLEKIKVQMQEAINLFEGKENPQGETFAQEFVRIYNEEVI